MKNVVGKKDVDLGEIREIFSELQLANDNLRLVRYGLAHGDCVDPSVVDSALYLANRHFDEMLDKLDKELYGAVTDADREHEALSADHSAGIWV